MLATQVLPEDTLNNATQDESEIVGHLLINSQRHEIRKGENKIGRDASCCSIVIENCTISKIHAVIESEGGDDTFIYDCGSTNFTKLNKTKLKPHCRYKLDDRSDMVLGNVVATFILAPSVNFPELKASKTIPVNTQALDELDDIFDLPTQVTIPGSVNLRDESKPPVSFKIPNSVNCNKKESTQSDCKSDSGYIDLENSEIFNLSTQCQLQNPTQECNTEKVKSLLDDGQDDVLCNFMSQQCDDKTEIDIFDVPTQVDKVDPFGNVDLITKTNDEISLVKQRDENETEIYGAVEKIKNAQTDDVIFIQELQHLNSSASDVKFINKNNTVIDEKLVMLSEKEKETKEGSTDEDDDVIFTQRFELPNNQADEWISDIDEKEDILTQKSDIDNSSTQHCQDSQDLIVNETRLVEFSERIESILSNGFKDETKPVENSGDETLSDLEMENEKSFIHEQDKTQPEMSSSQNSNDSYTFEVDPKRPETDSDATDCEVEFLLKKEPSKRMFEDAEVAPTNIPKERSPSPRCWSPLSLVMPSTQDVKSTMDKFLQRENQVGNEQGDSPLKRSRTESVEESPAKKPKTEKGVSKLWKVHDVGEIRPTRTRYSLRTPSTNKESCRRSARGRKSNPEITPYLIRCRRKKESFRESTRVLMSRKCESFDTPARKKRTKVDTPVIALTGFESVKLEKVIDDLGGRTTKDLMRASVVVADKVRRTVKFLCAVGLSLPITSPEWLSTCKKENKFVNPTKFILKDEEAEDKWDFDLKSTLERSRRMKLLEGYSVFATKSTKPPVKDLLAIVECCGGTAIVEKPTTWPRKTIIVSCEEDREAWPPPRVRNIKLVHYEFILTGVLRQKIDFKSYNLR